MIGRRVITTRHCTKCITGLCERFPGETTLVLSSTPLGKLFLNDGKQRYSLEFACDRCEMDVFTEGPTQR